MKLYCVYEDYFGNVEFNPKLDIHIFTTPECRDKWIEGLKNDTGFVPEFVKFEKEVKE